MLFEVSTGKHNLKYLNHLFCHFDFAEVLGDYVNTEGNCLEMFARNLTPRWTSWGNEVGNSFIDEKMLIGYVFCKFSLFVL
jgi:hypothetical protein